MTIGECVRWACILEATVPKPGNVHSAHSFPNMTYDDLIVSASAIAPVLGGAAGRPVGETVLRCIQATRAAVATNTNLGIVLLLAPLVVGDDVAATLNRTTIHDAIHVYEAIRLAKPGGMGQVPEQDITAMPTVTLREAMALAADRDSIARQYVNNFADVFAGIEYLANRRVYPGGNNLAGDIIDLHVWFLSRIADSLVRRKRGDDEALHLQSLARAALADRTQMPTLLDWFAAEFPNRNPGTTADLVCASLFVALRRGIITLPQLPDGSPLTP